MLLQQSGHRLLLSATGALLLILTLGLLVRPLVHTKPTNTNTPASIDIDNDASPTSTPIHLPEPPPEDANHILTLDYPHETREHNVIHSSLSSKGTYISLDFGDYDAFNPNIIPHPYRNETWIMAAHAGESSFHNPDDPDMGPGPVHATELYCDATYHASENKLKCVKSPLAIPISPTASERCTDDLEFFNVLIGPGEPRVFMGPDRPYVMFVMASQFTCMSVWLQDLRRLVRWPGMKSLEKGNAFFEKTELQRPGGAYNTIEKNWFAFWDAEGGMYLHYTVVPERSFARVGKDGKGVGEELGGNVKEQDGRCMERLLPVLKAGEKIHQATNSLAVTLCKRSEPDCGAGTFVMTVFHHKMYYGAHNLYEPYVMLFHNTAPFGLYGISERPFWISGRGMPGQSDDSPKASSEMMYITSINWKERGLNYHGFLDDEIWIGFGIEDKKSGGIDVIAEDLLRDIGVC